MAAYEHDKHFSMFCHGKKIKKKKKEKSIVTIDILSFEIGFFNVTLFTLIYMSYYIPICNAFSPLFL